MCKIYEISCVLSLKKSKIFYDTFYIISWNLMEIQVWDFKQVVTNTSANTLQKKLRNSGTFWVIKKSAESCVKPPRLTLQDSPRLKQ